MKEKILAAIKAKFPKVNLSKARLNAIAAKIETKVIDDETKIDAAIDEFNDFNPLADIAKSDDKIRNLEAKVNPPAPAKKDDDPPADTVDVPDDTPAWAKTLIEANKTLSATVAAMQGKEAANTIKGKAADQLKDVPESYWSNWSIPQKDEELEAFVENVKTQYATFTQDLADKGLRVVPTPTGSNPPAGGSTVVSPEVKAFMEKQQKVVANTPEAQKNKVITNTN